MEGNSSTDESLKSLIISRVASCDIRKSGKYPDLEPGFKRAAVLLPISIRDGKVYILLTKRPGHMRSHPSSAAFPGGVQDASDTSDIDTALREAKEEVGLPPDCVQILGVLIRGITLPNVIVYTVVGLIPAWFQPVPNPAEVEFAFFLPLETFLDLSNLSNTIYEVAEKSFITRSLYYEDGDKKAVVWGFTSNFCILLAKIIFNDTSLVPVYYQSGKVMDMTYSEGLEDFFYAILNYVKKKSNL